jgi:hypothetical protein
LHTKVLVEVSQLTAPYAPEDPLAKPTVPVGVAPLPAGELLTVALQLEPAPAICGEGEQTSNTEVPRRPEEWLVEVEPIEEVLTEEELIAVEVTEGDVIVNEEVDEIELPEWDINPYAPPIAITEPTRMKETRYDQRRERLTPSRRALSLDMGGASLEILVLLTRRSTSRRTFGSLA